MKNTLENSDTFNAEKQKNEDVLKNENNSSSKNPVENECDKPFEEKTVDIKPADEDDGEDLPDNFFDDFSNTDFIAGLDIVDDWIDDSVVNTENSTEKAPSKKENKKHDDKPSTSKHTDKAPKRTLLTESELPKRSLNRSGPKFSYRSKERSLSRGRKSRDRSPHRRSRERSPLRIRRSRERSPLRVRRSRERSPYRYRRSREKRNSKEYRQRGYIRSRSRERRNVHDKLNDKRSDKHTNSPSKKNSNEKSDSEAADARRDPEKTKRDIERDKIRCEKDLKARVFQEQLKVAQTGLVPPGMEDEVVLQSEKFNEKLSKNNEGKNTTDTRSNQKKSKSPQIVSKHHFEKSSSSAYKQDRSPLFIEIKNKHKSPYEDRNVDLRVHLRQKREKYTDQLSPVSEINFANSSPESVVSERESWLRSKDRPGGKYRRVGSPIKPPGIFDRRVSPKRNRSKPTFLEEISKKLRDHDNQKPNYQAGRNMFGSQDLANPIAASQSEYYQMPANSSFRKPQSYQMNSQSFVSNSQGFSMEPKPGSQVYFQPCSSDMPLPSLMTVPVPVPAPMSVGHPLPVPHPSSLTSRDPMFPVQPYQLPQATSTNALQSSQQVSMEYSKLFEDKKISLSNYLSASAKQIDPKISSQAAIMSKVLTRCNEVIEALSENSNMVGRFFPRIRYKHHLAKPILPKNISPLKKTTSIKYQFTSGFSSKVEPFYVMTLWKLLALVGIAPSELSQHTVHSIPEWEEELVVAEAEVISSDEESPQKKTAASTRPRTPDAPIITPKGFPMSMQKVKCSSAAVQTNFVECEICEVRSSIKNKNQGMQTDNKLTIDVSTQVNLEDLSKSRSMFNVRSILKNSNIQSLAHMTPAQILAQNEKQKMDIQRSSAARNELFPITTQDKLSTPEKNSSSNFADKNRLGFHSNINAADSRLSGNTSFPKSSGFGNNKPAFAGNGSAGGNINRFSNNFISPLNDPFRNISTNLDDARDFSGPAQRAGPNFRPQEDFGDYDHRYPDGRGPSMRGRGGHSTGYGNFNPRPYFK